MKIANWPLVMVFAAGCVGQIEPGEVDENEAALGGFSTPYNPHTVGVVRVTVGASYCTGTLLDRYYVLTAKSCILNQAASNITVTLPHTNANTQQSSSVRWTITDPAMDAALLYLNTAITPANAFPTVRATGPTSNETLFCYGYGVGNFLQGGSLNGSNHASGTFDITNGFIDVEAGDIGGPCLDTANNAIVGVIKSVATRNANAKAISGVGVTGTTMDGVSGTTTLTQWVSDMIHLSNLRPGRYSYTFFNRNSNKALDVAWGNLLPGEAVNQVQQNGGLNQNWYEEYTDFPYMRLVSAKSGKCLDINGANKLTQNTCSSAASQKWRATYLDNTYFRISSFTNGCADIPGGDTQNGTRVQKFGCHSGTNQQFYRQSH